MIAAMLGLLDPGDEIVVFEPYYENYGPDAILAGAIAALRDAPRAGLVDRPGRAARGVRAADAGDRRQLAAQPDRQGLHAARSSS